MIDHWLDRITMYRLILYYLVAILAVAVGLASFGQLSYSPAGILESAVILLGICAISNLIFAKVFRAATNIESTYVTALILACILPPVHSVQDLPLLVWAAVLAIASKYVLAIRNKHVFNPAAIAVVLTAFWLNESAIWWVGTGLMAPVVIVGGLLMVRKLRRYDLVLSFFLTSLLISVTYSLTAGSDLLTSLSQLALRSPLFFFAFVMLTEPLTSPPTKSLQTYYGGLVGILAAPQVHFGSLYLTPELALVIGNLFSYAVSPKIKERLELLRHQEVATGVTEFEFQPKHRFAYAPGQYMEFTLPHGRSDSRGVRRYFTIASSPTEETVKLGVKFYESGSSFKRALALLTPNQSVMVGQLAGDFTLPKNSAEKLVFIAGGIGVTPFRSMLKYLSDKQEMRNITLIYVNKQPEDVAYREVFETTPGLKTVYVYTAAGQGRLSEAMIQEEVPDLKERTAYVSGPQAMVTATDRILQNLGVSRSRIKKDFFPGLA